MIYTNEAIFQMLGFWLPIIILVIIWSLIWKGIGLWKAAKQGDTGWFIVFLIINTLGVLEILYIYFYSPLRLSQIEASNKEKNRLTAEQSKKKEE